jgi:Heterokaryon incompatibility protein (HET)
MRLINTTSLVLETIEDPETCLYAILSHTWGEDEVSFNDMADLERARTRRGFSKIERTCQLARQRNLEYAWVDTCCIDKSSSAELTEAINSMFRWYKQSHVCFVYLSDLLSTNESLLGTYLPQCRWFTRGWTLQELVASEEIEFYNYSWNLIGTDESLRILISAITGIDWAVLSDSDMLNTIPVARRMSWAASRQTTRVEDRAYCLFGIFDVNLPLIYGEGQKAFIRLQEAIAREINDLSLFAWISRDEDILPRHRRRDYRGILAESPAEFKECDRLRNISDPAVLPAQVSITSQGFIISDRLIRNGEEYLLNLDCDNGSIFSSETIVIRLVRTAHGYVRYRSGQLQTRPLSLLRTSALSSLPIAKTISVVESQAIQSRLRHQFSFHVNSESLLVDYKTEMRPQHLWDSATNSFITDGYELFTAIILVKIVAPDGFGFKQRVFSKGGGPSPDPLTLFIILGFAPAVQGPADSRTGAGKALNPWAGIYLLHRDSNNSMLSQIIDEEESRGVPEVVRQARHIILSRAKEEGLPIACEHAINRFSTGSWPEKLMKFDLSTESEETSDLSLFKIVLNIRQPS